MEVVDPHRRRWYSHRMDHRRREPQRLDPLGPTLDAAGERGLLLDDGTLWLDRGYNSEITRLRLAERALDDAIIAKKR